MGDNEGVIGPNECDPPLVSPLCPGGVQEGGGGGGGQQLGPYTRVMLMFWSRKLMRCNLA